MKNTNEMELIYGAFMKDMEKAGLVYSEGRGAEKEYYLKKQIGIIEMQYYST